LQVETEHSSALPEGLSTQDLLWSHFLLSWERLRALASISEDRPALNQHTEYSPELVSQAYARALGFELLFSRMRRIQGYLDSRRKRPMSDALSALEFAKSIRANIQRGDSDEAIAFFLERWKSPEKRRGRPKVSSDSESLAVLALQLHDSNPKLWTWPKVADQLLNCKSHTPHEWDSECTARLKQAVARLRAFLKELQSD